MSFNYGREQLMGDEGRSRGKDFERDLFGEPNVGDAKYRKELMAVSDKKTGYVPFETALELVGKIQLPREKNRPFARKLIHKIAEILGKYPKFNESRVRFYTTVDTPLDQFHGADAIIELILKDKSPIRVRLGATTANNTVKSERKSKQSDVEIEEGWLNLEDEEILNNQKIPELAAQIIHQFERKTAIEEK